MYCPLFSTRLLSLLGHLLSGCSNLVDIVSSLSLYRPQTHRGQVSSPPLPFISCHHTYGLQLHFNNHTSSNIYLQINYFDILWLHLKCSKKGFRNILMKTLHKYFFQLNAFLNSNPQRKIL